MTRSRADVRSCSTAWLLTALSPMCLSACGPVESQASGVASDDARQADASATTTPTETLTAMLTVAESGDWGRFVDEFYGEQSKFGGPHDRAALVARFEEAWGSRMIEGLREAVDLEPRATADGRAEFARGESVVFVLHPDGRGGWAFHL